MPLRGAQPCLSLPTDLARDSQLPNDHVDLGKKNGSQDRHVQYPGAPWCCRERFLVSFLRRKLCARKRQGAFLIGMPTCGSVRARRLRKKKHVKVHLACQGRSSEGRWASTHRPESDGNDLEVRLCATPLKNLRACTGNHKFLHVGTQGRGTRPDPEADPDYLARPLSLAKIRSPCLDPQRQARGSDRVTLRSSGDWTLAENGRARFEIRLAITPASRECPWAWWNSPSVFRSALLLFDSSIARAFTP